MTAASTMLRNAAIGAASGIAAAWVMNSFQNGWTALKKEASGGGRSRDEQHHSGNGNRRGERSQNQRDEGEPAEEQTNKKERSKPATVKAADDLSLVATGQPVPQPDKKTAGEAVHYTFGAVVGAIYGALGTAFPGIRSGFGTVYATGVALVADETLVPALDWGPPPQKTPLSTHAYSLVSHWVFGAALEASRRTIDGALGQSTGAQRNAA